MPYDPTVAHISTHISALGNTPVLIHFTLCIVWHIDQSEPIEHSVDVGHAPDIAQRFWTVNHCSDLFHIAQRQQHRAPRQTFAVFPAVDPEFPCVFAASAFSYFIREWQAGIGFKTHFLIHQNYFPQIPHNTLAISYTLCIILAILFAQSFPLSSCAIT